MARPWALYVEDEVGKATDRFQHEISAAGFNVARAYSSQEALTALDDSSARGELVDLVVLDRKLPEVLGDRAVEQTGDRLFEEIEARYPDTPIIVLTGYSDEDFALLVLQRRNTLDLGLREPIQRIAHFKKGRALNFREALGTIGGALRQTENVALEGAPEKRATRRVLKRVGQLFKGAVVRARPAAGGSSDASVWLCEVFAHDGRWLTSVVLKIGPHDEARPAGGFMASVPPANAAQPTHRIEGACGGLSGHVAPLAGRDPASISDMLLTDEASAVEAVGSVVRLLDEVPAAMISLPINEFLAPLIEWTRAEEIAQEHGILLPDRHLPVPTHHGCLHGDLHPGNVLMDSGRPVFIDFDRQRSGSLIMDYLSLALGAVFNKVGPLRARPPTLADVEQVVAGAVDESTWYGACSASWDTREFGHRERWAALLAFVLRQLKYDDILEDSARRSLAIQLANRASTVLMDS